MSGHVTERLETEKKWVCVFVCLHVTRGTLNSSASSAYPHGWSAMQWPNLTQNILFPIYMPHSSTDWKTKSFYPMEIKRKYTKATLKTEGHFMCTFKSFSLLNKEKKPDWGDIKIHFILPFSFFLKFNFFTNLTVWKSCGFLVEQQWILSSCDSNAVSSICGINSSSFLSDYILKEVI